MAHYLFPEMEKEPTMQDLIELKIKRLLGDLHYGIRVIECEDAKGEIHKITFRPVDASGIAVHLDDVEVANLLTEV